jgi:hypothetical protein
LADIPIRRAASACVIGGRLPVLLLEHLTKTRERPMHQCKVRVAVSFAWGRDAFDPDIGSCCSCRIPSGALISSGVGADSLRHVDRDERPHVVKLTGHLASNSVACDVFPWTRRTWCLMLD